MARPTLLLSGVVEGLGIDSAETFAKAGRMNAAAFARTYPDLSTQHPSAWTREMDPRPFSECF